ncbi:NAD(P)/FAD-dependent oxidoreductase [Leucobacter soli]
MILDRGEVIVVGGGIVGTTTAWFLAERGVDVVLVEQEDLAYGASGRNMGFLVISNRCSGIELDFALHGRSLYEGFSEQLGNTFEYRSSGGLAFFNDEADAALFREFAEERRSVGLTTDYLEPSEVREVAPILTGDVVGGVFCAEDGMIRTPKFVAALGAECARRGVRIHTQTTATRLKRGADGKVIGVETTRGQVLGDRVVWAAGVWSKLLADEGIEINMEIERLGALLTTPIAETVDPVLYGPSIATMYRHFRTLSSFESTYADRQELLSGKFTQNINQIDGGNLMLGCPMDYPNSFEDHPCRRPDAGAQRVPAQLPGPEGRHRAGVGGPRAQRQGRAAHHRRYQGGPGASHRDRARARKRRRPGDRRTDRPAGHGRGVVVRRRALLPYREGLIAA